MDYLLVYLWTRLDALQTLLGIVGGLGIITCIIIAIICCVESECFYLDDDEKQKYKNFYKGAVKYIPLSLFIILLAALTPSKEDFAVIYVLPKLKNGVVSVATSKQVQTIPDKLLQLANKKLDEMITPPVDVKER
jgi:small-conductance mechanosensitive channel